MKRFYKVASVAERGANWGVTLDGKAVKTPRGSFLELPTLQLAQAVAREWGKQGEALKPREMPLTTVACTAMDLIRPEKEECIGRIIPFLVMDTLCFVDDQDKLAALQAEEWGPVRSWFEDHFQVKLGIGRGLFGPQHAEFTVPAVEAQLQQRDEWELASLEIATHTAKSFIVAAALIDRSDIAVNDAFRWALLEEHYQIERWGLVEGEHDVSHGDTMMWFETCRRFGRLGRTEAIVE